MEDYIRLKDIPSKWGLQKGDTVFISSDITAIGEICMVHGEKFKSNELLDAVIETIGPTGTILLPTYNWGFCHGETFDYKKTKGKTGILGNAALRREDFKRTQHPIYSFAVWGKDQEYLCALQNKSAFEEDSPFGYLRRNHAINIIINVPLEHSFTFTHYVEQMMEHELEIHYRYHKDFTSVYRDADGREETRTYSMFVRYLDLEPIPSRGDELQKTLQDAGTLTLIQINGVVFKRIDLAASVPAIIEYLKVGPYYGKKYYQKS